MDGSVLVVEDDPDILDLAKELLEQRGHRVYTALNGAEALKRLGEIDPPSLVLLDLFMPVMDGTEFLRRLRAAADPRIAALRVVIVSAAVGTEADAASDMADDFLKKPVAVEELLRTVARYCGR